MKLPVNLLFLFENRRKNLLRNLTSIFCVMTETLCRYSYGQYQDQSEGTVQVAHHNSRPTGGGGTGRGKGGAEGRRNNVSSYTEKNIIKSQMQLY